MCSGLYCKSDTSEYRVQQANFLFHMAFHIQKRKLACRTLYYNVLKLLAVITCQEYHTPGKSEFRVARI
jgi:hypothetical protein